jgi:hypothetical protein
MSAFKSLTSQDVIITPFVVNKSFTFEGTASFETASVGIDRFIGVNIPNSDFFVSESDPTTGQISTQYQRDVYNSIKQLYYTNYIPNPISGSYIITDSEGNIVESDLTTNVYSRFDNYLQTTLSQSREFPTGSYDKVSVISIPEKLFGDYINPNTFRYTYAFIPDSIIVSASLTSSFFVKSEINGYPLINGSGSIYSPISWSVNTNTLNWFSGGVTTPVQLFSPYNIEVTCSFPGNSSSLYVAPQNYSTSITSYTVLVGGVPYVVEATASSITMSLAIDNGNNNYTIITSGSLQLSQSLATYLYLSASDLTYTGSNIVLIPNFNPSDPAAASTIPNIQYKVIDSGLGKVSFKDNGEGNIVKTNDESKNLGIIIYSHGIVALTDVNLVAGSFISESNATCSFQSARTIYETQVKCTIRENEFNYSLNPSLISGSINQLLTSASINSAGQVYDFVTGSFFAPYVTTVGLYNDNNELLAVAKLAQPLPTSRTTDMSILVNIDR